MLKLRKGMRILLKNIVLEIDKTEYSDKNDGWVTFKSFRVRRWWVNKNLRKILK